MEFEFDTLINRQGIGNMKEMTTAESVRQAGLISYVGAEMDFKTAPVVIDAITQRAQNGLLGFTLPDEHYREAVLWWMKTQRSWQIETDWIVPTMGTIFSVATALRMVTRPGESMIVHPPVYNRYKQAADRLGRKTLECPLINDGGVYRMDFEHLESLMALPESKLMVLCNPHNPTGNLWSRGELEQVAVLANRYGVVVFSDEIFAEVVFGPQRCIPFVSVKGGAECGITSTSLGKTFNFTGVNHANMIIPSGFLRRRFTAQRDADHYGSLEPLVHAALLGAYSPQGAAWKDAMVTYVDGNIRLLEGFFAQHLPMVITSPVQGGFVLWMDWRALGMEEDELNAFLLEKAYLELDAGSHYGEAGRGFTRMNVAAPRRVIEKSLAQLLVACREKGILKGKSAG